MNVRNASSDDLVRLQEIYAHHVRYGTGSFEVEPPGVDEMRARFTSITAAGYPYLVAEDASRIVGYAYASAYRARFAYRFTVEDSIYIAHDCVGQGVGKALLNALIARCTAKGFRQMVAAIGDSANAGSIALHARAGFRVAGALPAVGFKHGRWLDSVFMTLPLGEGERSAPGVIAQGHD